VSYSPHRAPAILMMAYSYYESDPRVIRAAEAAVSAGFDVDFLALRRPDSPAIELVRGVQVIRVNYAKYRGGGRLAYILSYLRFFISCFLKTTALWFKRRYVAVHVNNMPDFLVFTTLLPKLFGAIVLLDIHDPMPNTFASKFKQGNSGILFRLLLWQELLSAAYCDRVLTVHEPVKSGILVEHGLPPDSIEVIANFADDNVFQLRRSFSVKGKVRLVFHGTIVERSGLRILMTALARVRHKDAISVRIIGEGDFSQGLKDLIHQYQIEDVVDFDNHSYPVHSIPALIENCNVGLVPLEISSATNYALPLKLLEYVSLGLPVVAVRNEAITHYFKENDCIFFDGNDADSLSATLDRIAEHPEILTCYRERSVALRPRFLWSTEKVKYIDLLRQLTGAGEVDYVL
jgi:glycosyltransferase involved in cell wall biosynthesis